MTCLVILNFDDAPAVTQLIIVSNLQRTIGALHLPFRSVELCKAFIGLSQEDCLVKLQRTDVATAERCVETYRCIFDEDNPSSEVSLFPHVLPPPPPLS